MIFSKKKKPEEVSQSAESSRKAIGTMDDRKIKEIGLTLQKLLDENNKLRSENSQFVFDQIPDFASVLEGIKQNKGVFYSDQKETIKKIHKLLSEQNAQMTGKEVAKTQIETRDRTEKIGDSSLGNLQKEMEKIRTNMEKLMNDFQSLQKKTDDLADKNNFLEKEILELKKIKETQNMPTQNREPEKPLDLKYKPQAEKAETEPLIEDYWKPFIEDFKKVTKEVGEEVVQSFIQLFTTFNKEIIEGDYYLLAGKLKRIIEEGDRILVKAALLDRPEKWEQYKNSYHKKIYFEMNDEPCFFAKGSALEKVNEVITKEFCRIFNDLHAQLHSRKKGEGSPPQLIIRTLKDEIGGRTEDTLLGYDDWDTVNGTKYSGDKKIRIMLNRNWEIRWVPGEKNIQSFKGKFI